MKRLFKTQEALQCLVLGGLVEDRYLEVPALPPRGGDVLIRKTYALAGGCAVNMAVTFNNLGGQAHLVSYVGEDEAGQRLLAYFHQHQLSTRHLRSSPGQTGYCYVILEADGERTFLTHKGVECRFRQELLENKTAEADLILLSGYYLLDAAGGPLWDALEGLLPATRCLLFDPGPLVSQIDPSLLKEVMAAAHIIAASQEEARAMDLQIRPHQLIVIKEGAAGGRVYTEGRSFSYAAHPARVVDTTGAGDSFAAGLLTGIVWGHSPEDAVDLAAACAAKTISFKGPHGFWTL